MRRPAVCLTLPLAMRDFCVDRVDAVYFGNMLAETLRHSLYVLLDQLIFFFDCFCNSISLWSICPPMFVIQPHLLDLTLQLPAVKPGKEQMQHHHLSCIGSAVNSFKCLVSNCGPLTQTQHKWCCYKNKMSLFHPADFS